MFGKPFQYRLAAVTALLTVAALFLGSLVYQHQAKAAPLERDLARVEGVEEVAVERVDGAWHIRVRLHQVPLLPVAYKELRQRADQRLGEDRYVLELVDRRDARLQEAFYQLSYYLEEARAQGEYAEAAHRVEEKGRQLALERAQLFVDPDYLYLELVDDGATLYHVQPLRPGEEADDR